MLINDPIVSFTGEYRWLSNFWLTPIVWGQYVYPSTENAYQAMKTLKVGDMERFQHYTPGKAKREGSKLELRSDWETAKLYVMQSLTDIKYQNEELAQKLIATGDALIIEGNTWGDRFWGQSPVGNGQNWLGKILMSKRDALQHDLS